MEVKKIKEKLQKDNLIFKLIMFFTIGCLFGCIFETVLCFVQRGYFESRKGLIYGPFNPVYGLGVVAMILALRNRKSMISIFITGFLTGGVIEYLCSWIQESMFSTVSWNYKDYFLNFNGRTSLFHMLCWGVISIGFMKFIYPVTIKMISKIKEKDRKPIMILLTIFFILDLFISGYACMRQWQRLNKIEATTHLQRFFDKCYPDKVINKVYPNRRDSKTRQKINRMK